MVDTPEKESSRLPWGMGRIAFTAQRQRIEELMAKGYPKTMIYEELKPNLNGLSYSQFVVLVRKNLGGATPRKYSEKPSGPVGLEPPQNLPTMEEKHPKKWNPKTPNNQAFKGFVPGPKEPNPADLW
jgi:hypothetical protein